MFEAKKIKKLVMGVVMILSTVNVFQGVDCLTVSHAAKMNTTAGLDNITVSKDGIQGAEDSTDKALNSALDFIKWISLAGTLLLLGVFIINLLKLGASGTNVQARAAAQQGLVWSGISAAVLSIASTVFFFLGGVLTDAGGTGTE